MSVANRISEQEYLRLAASEVDRFLELWNGEARTKPSMSLKHNRYMLELSYVLRGQLDIEDYEVRFNSARLRSSRGQYFIPDVVVLPTPIVREQEEFDRPGYLETYEAPAQLVIEVWSLSTGDYDLSVKLAAYQARGDAEIWRLHPYERTLTRWVCQADGSYGEESFVGGIVALAALGGVTVDLDALFAMSAR